MPVWVRSFVPNEKKSASLAIWSAVSAARGISIMVPTVYGSDLPAFANSSSTAFTTIAR